MSMDDKKNEGASKEQSKSPEDAGKGNSRVPVSFRCVTKCHYQGRLFRVGDTLVSDDEGVPEFFVKRN